MSISLDIIHLSATSHITLPDKCCLSQGMNLYQVMMTLHFLNNVANEAESTQKSKIRVIITSLMSETMGKLIN